jgi:mono/diheme cytochrome c family protein
VLVNTIALCGGCHTAAASGSPVLGGNALFANGALPAPNLTNDPTGIGEWTDAQVINAFRNGIDDEGRHLSPTMPYWLFHNMTDGDALAVVAYLRSLPPATAAIGAANPEVAPVTPLAPSSLPDSTLPSTDPDYAAAQQGKYLVSAVAQCVKCHSPAGPPPVADFFAGVPPTVQTPIFASNITPDVTTGLGGWTAADVVTALKAGTNKAGVTLCGSMPSAGKGYGAMSDADARAIGVYLTTIPAVSKPTAAPGLEPACPVTP